MSLSGDDEAELRGYWDKLSEGGTVTLALEKQMWGDVFGMCVDRFGTAWMVNIAQPQGEYARPGAEAAPRPGTMLRRGPGRSGCRAWAPPSRPGSAPWPARW